MLLVELIEFEICMKKGIVEANSIIYVVFFRNLVIFQILFQLSFCGITFLIKKNTGKICLTNSISHLAYSSFEAIEKYVKMEYESWYEVHTFH